MAQSDDGRGILYPAGLPTFHRVPAPPQLRDLVRWFWIPRWSLPPGQTSRQELLPFPASNLVVMPGRVLLAGPTSGASHRDLRGQGWALGMLLRPAALASMHPQPRAIRDAELVVDAPELCRSVSEAMRLRDQTAGSEQAVLLATAWAAERFGAPDHGGLLANAMEDRIASDPSIVRVDQLAQRLHLSVRGVQRIAQRYVGLPPLTIIRRYRLQEAAQRLRADPALSITRIAADLGYADHAHLTTDFRRVLGLTPDRYRRHPGHSR